MDRGLTILAVDDDLINLKLLHSMLKKNSGVEKVLEASNGVDALNIIRENENIHLILLDIKMPVMDGIEFMENLSSIPEKRKIPVIVLTTDETRRHEAFDKGAFDFLVKPIREHDLHEKIEKIRDLI